MPDGTHFESPLFGLSQRRPPSNIQAEQALLGALLANNKAYDRVAEFLRPEHFIDPVHQAIFRAIDRRIGSGQLADALTLKAEFEHTGVLDSAGGVSYLAQLLTAMVGIVNAGEYGRAIHDAWIRRELIEAGDLFLNGCYGSEAEKSIHDIAAEHTALVDSIVTGTEVTRPKSLREAMTIAMEAGEAARKHGNVGVSTGLRSLDDAIKGLRPGMLTVLAARPGMGKSTLAFDIATNVAYEGEPVAYFSQEETTEDLGVRACAQLAQVPADLVRSGQLSAAHQTEIAKAWKAVDGLPMEIVEEPGVTLAYIALKARQAKRKFGRLSLIVVDHLQLMRNPHGSERLGLTWAVGENANGLKRLAKEMGCSVLLLSQLNREVEKRNDKRPQMSDLRQSGDIEAAADVVMMLYREEYYLLTNKPQRGSNQSDGDHQADLDAWEINCARAAGKAELSIPKVRGGKQSIVNLIFRGDVSRFEEA